MEERTKKFFDEIEKYINKVINNDELMKKTLSICIDTQIVSGTTLLQSCYRIQQLIQ